MAKVGIVMGSDSDLKVMSKAAEMLEELGVEYEITIISAHRQPDELIEWTRTAEDRDVRVIIAGAGMAAALPGMCAALYALPVIGVPLSGKNLDGMDAVYSIMQNAMCLGDLLMLFRILDTMVHTVGIKEVG